MAQSLPSIKIQPNAWIDLYAESGITVGVQLIMQNIGGGEAILSESVLIPTDIVGHNTIVPRSYLTNSASSVGAWAYSSTGTTLQVEEA